MLPFHVAAIVWLGVVVVTTTGVLSLAWAASKRDPYVGNITDLES